MFGHGFHCSEDVRLNHQGCVRRRDPRQDVERFELVIRWVSGAVVSGCKTREPHRHIIITTAGHIPGERDGRHQRQLVMRKNRTMMSRQLKPRMMSENYIWCWASLLPTRVLMPVFYVFGSMRYDVLLSSSRQAAKPSKK